jgi:PucR family transcriptional regulator, purine catabolism regulatory protein
LTLPVVLTVQDLLEAETLQLSLIAGERGLRRGVQWTHVSELENPAIWLEGGELLITNGLGIPADADGQAQFIRALAERHAAGLAIGVRGPALHPEALATAEEQEFALLTVPLEVPFLSIARMVADANQNSAQRRLLTHVRIFDTLRPGEHPTDPQTIFARLEDISGYDLYLTSAVGAPLISGFRPPPAEVIEAIGGEDFAPDSSNPAVPGGFAVPVPIHQRPDTFVVALERDAANPAAGLGAVRHIATIAALQLAGLYHERETRRRRAAEALSRLFAGQLDAQSVEDVLEELDLSSADPIVVIAFRTEGRVGLDDEIHHRLCDRAIPHAMAVDGDTFVVLPARDNRLDEVVAGLDVHGGASRERLGLRNWAIARKEASWALEQALSRDAPPGVRPFPSSDSTVHWLPSDIATLQSLVDENLESLITYDATHSSELVHSLKVYFEHDRKLTAAADELFIHKHTLTYRLRRVEQISGRSLSRLSDVVQLWLALQAHEIVGSGPAEPAR